MATAESRKNPKLLIDARPRGPGGPFACEFVQGKSVVDHLRDVAAAVSPDPSARVDVIASDDHPFPDDAIVLRADRLYDSNRLKRAIRRGDDPETAAYWRLDRPGGLAGADEEFARRKSYQPLGKYWAQEPARAIARFLAPTRVRPNAVTIASATLMLFASGLSAFASSTWYAHLTVAIAMAAALVLDTADGHLARLQGTASAFGRYLDAWLDELCDMVLHAAIAWGLFVQTASAWWLLLGMAYAMGKYVFYVGASVIPASKNGPTTNDTESQTSHARKWIRLAGHADVRWHLWIGLAAIGRLDLALLAYAVYFPARAALSLAGKATEARHA